MAALDSKEQVEQITSIRRVNTEDLVSKSDFTNQICYLVQFLIRYGVFSAAVKKAQRRSTVHVASQMNNDNVVITAFNAMFQMKANSATSRDVEIHSAVWFILIALSLMQLHRSFNATTVYAS